jgi:hypothetical protein
MFKITREGATALVVSFIIVQTGVYIAHPCVADTTSFAGYVAVGVLSLATFLGLHYWLAAMSVRSRLSGYTMTVESAAEPHIEMLGNVKPGTFEVDETQRADDSWKYVIRPNGGSVR